MGTINIYSSDGSNKAGLIYDGSGDITVDTEHLAHTSSNVQAQIDTKAPINNAQFTGNVGIGVSSPAQRLNINGRFQIDAGWEIKLQNAAQNGFAAIQNAGAGTNTDLGFSTGGSERMRIDSAGRVTMPYQPAFVATTVSTSTLPNNADVIFNSTVTNRGSIYNTSNGRFTAPVAGLYAIGAHIRVASTTNSITYHRLSLRKNGAYVQYSRGRLEGRNNGDYSYIANYIIIELAVNDYISTQVETGAGTTLQINSANESAFYGHLVG